MPIRRELLVALGAGAVGVPLVCFAQQRAGKVYRVGFLWDSPAVWPHALEGFRRGLRDLGWIEGQNIIIEYRCAQGRFDRLLELAKELVLLKVDVIVGPFNPSIRGWGKAARGTRDEAQTANDVRAERARGGGRSPKLQP